jgi:hypothetical protein
MATLDTFRRLAARYQDLRDILARVAPRYVPGAVGDGKADDTDAIQAALDRPAHAVQLDDRPSGIELYLPAGTYRVTRPLRIHGNTVIRGDKRATMIDALDVAGDVPLFDLVGTDLGGTFYNAGCEIARLSMRTRGHGIGSTTPGGTILDLTVDDVQICSTGWGVTFPDQYCQQVTLRDVHQNNPGSGGVRFWGNLNTLERYKIRRGVGGPVGEAFKSPWVTAKQAMIDVTGQGNTLRQNHVEFRGAPDDQPILPFAIRGTVGWGGWTTLENNWPEFQPGAGRLAEDCVMLIQGCEVFGAFENNGPVKYVNGGRKGD